MDAREIESLSMLARGFADLRDANPELAYRVVLDILAGINENGVVRQHVHTQRAGLFPHRRVMRRSEMTARGLVVHEQEEDIGSGTAAVVPGLPVSSPGNVVINNSNGAVVDETTSSPRKSPIAELLYMRWLEGLKLKWPNIL